MAKDTSHDDELAALKAALEASNRERDTFRVRAEAAESGKAGAERQVLSEAERRVQAEIAAVESALASNETEAESIVAEIDAAQAEGKPTGALQRKLAKVEASSTDLTNRKTYYGQQLERAKEAAKAPPPVQTQKLADGTPLGNFSASMQAWAKDHPELLTSRAAVMRGYAADAEARERNVVVESKEYFDILSAAVRGVQPVQQATDDDDASAYSSGAAETDEAAQAEAAAAIARQTAAKPQPGPAGSGSMRATPTRQVPGNPAARGRVPALSADQREVADFLYASIKDPRERYAKYVTDKEFMDNRHGRGVN